MYVNGLNSANINKSWQLGSKEKNIDYFFGTQSKDAEIINEEGDKQQKDL